MGITTRDLLDHLFDRYGKITPADIEECKRKMHEPMDTTQPIDIFFQKIDECVQYAADGQVAFTADQILNTVYHAISTAGLYTDACKEWRRKAPADKDWHNFKRFFAAEYHDLKEQNKINNNQTHFHGANAVVDIAEALDNLALAATTDRDVVAQLTAITQQLTATNKTLTEQLAKALESNNTLIKQVGHKTKIDTTSNLGNPTGTRKPFDQAAWIASLDPNGYCWTHGYRVIMGHNSKDCGGKLGGHKDAATRANIMGGSVKGKPA